jgi:glycerol dehydrogenase
MITATLFPGKYIQGYDAIQELKELIPRYGKRGIIICSPSVFEKVIPGIHASIKEVIPVVVEKFAGECSDEEITRLMTIAGKEACDVVIGIGGGKTLDTAKAIAH